MSSSSRHGSSISTSNSINSVAPTNNTPTTVTSSTTTPVTTSTSSSSSSSTSTTTTSRKPQLINSNSVQTQFQTLASQKTLLQQQIRQADADRLVETQTIARIRQAQQNLMERIRIASSNNGVEEKKRETLKNEVMRLDETLKDDQKELKELSLEVDQLKTKEMESKYQFVKEMEAINDEMADALRRCEECNLENILTLESCRVIEEYLVQKMNMYDNDDHDHNRHQEPAVAAWKERVMQIGALVKSLEECHEKCQREKATQSLLLQTASDLRNTVQQKNYDALGEEELNSLELLWEQQYDSSSMMMSGKDHLIVTTTSSSSMMTDKEEEVSTMATTVAVTVVGDDNGNVPMVQEEEEKEQKEYFSSSISKHDSTVGGSGSGGIHELPVNMHLFYGQA